MNWSDAQIGELQEIELSWSLSELYDEAMQIKHSPSPSEDENEDDEEDT